MMTKPPFQIQILPVTPFQQNCSIIKTASGKIALVDPGGEPEKILEAVAKIGGEIEKIWLTHGHLDHAGGAAEIKRQTGCVIEGPHKDDIFWLDQIEESWRKYGHPGMGENVHSDRWLEDGDSVELDGIKFDVFFTPGHTPGHVIFYNKDAQLAFVGDVLFKGSIGRTDFPRGDHQTLLDSITKKLWPLGNETRFVPGHGPISSFGEERRSNPFVGDQALSQ
jgi:hydroxyacylglutathione hydrolase